LELGWVVVAKAHCGRGYSRLILDALLSRSEGRCVYATSASTNLAIHKTLTALAFDRDGRAWPSQERKGVSLILFVRNAAVRPRGRESATRRRDKFVRANILAG
jgi:RimJ/RimL family protein N-acetyltransferase